MNAPHTVPLDAIAAEEIGSIVATLEAIDTDLLARGLTNAEGDARSLLDLRIRMSGRLERWLREFGATPASRAEWAERVAPGRVDGGARAQRAREGSRATRAGYRPR
jgi:hypothetical protein